jgi:predicted ATPase
MIVTALTTECVTQAESLVRTFPLTIMFKNMLSTKRGSFVIITASEDWSYTTFHRAPSKAFSCKMSTRTPKTEAEKNLANAASVPFYKVVLTGGPCGGKTTALARLSSYLRERGFEVISCPECYTILASNGLSAGFYSTQGIDTVIQNAVLDVQISLEDSLSNVLKARGKPAVLLCDRGPMDGKAYLTEEKWQEILDGRGISEVDLRDNRYNAVYHMVSAADGARKYYSLDNNTARSESPEEACALDKVTQKCWLGHPHM